MLELGCAKGFLIDHLYDLNINAIGYDISEYAVNQAKHPSRVLLRDMTKPQDFSFFDLVVSFDFLEHIEEKRLDNVLANLRTARQQFHMITTTEYDFGGDETHYTSKPKQWWVDKFNAAGIKNYRIIHAGEQAETFI